MQAIKDATGSPSDGLDLDDDLASWGGWMLGYVLMCTWMSCWKLGSMVRINGLFHLLINVVCWGEITH